MLTKVIPTSPLPSQILSSGPQCSSVLLSGEWLWVSYPRTQRNTTITIVLYPSNHYSTMPNEKLQDQWKSLFVALLQMYLQPCSLFRPHHHWHSPGHTGTCSFLACSHIAGCTHRMSDTHQCPDTSECPWTVENRASRNTPHLRRPRNSSVHSLHLRLYKICVFHLGCK